MRDLSFLLRLHAFPPLARFSRTPRKPYLPLEVRYLIRPSEEVFLYLSNNSDNKTWGDDLSLMLCRRGLACHYLPLYEARWRPLYEYPPQENIVFPQTEQYAFLQPIFLLLSILSAFGVGCLVAARMAISIINGHSFLT